jgi:hypothetical protein
MPQNTERLPESIEMVAIPRSIPSVSAASESDILARFVVNPHENTVTYTLSAEAAASSSVHVHGYVPRGWITDPLMQLSEGQRTGSWNYPQGDEKNILAGLAYLTIRSKNGQARVMRAQIERVSLPEPSFEEFVTVTMLAGECQGKMTVFGLLDDVPMKMEPAQVILARTPARQLADGRRDQEIGCAIRVGGADIPGVGRAEIGMFGDRNPGHIVSMKPGSDFPARMTLDVRKSYITPAGTFYRDNEEFFADNITRFPPFGVKFTPVEPIAPLRNARNGEIVGQIRLEWLVPLCYVDASEFPSKAIARATIEEETV